MKTIQHLIAFSLGLALMPIEMFSHNLLLNILVCIGITATVLMVIFLISNLENRINFFEFLFALGVGILACDYPMIINEPSLLIRPTTFILLSSSLIVGRCFRQFEHLEIDLEFAFIMVWLCPSIYFFKLGTISGLLMFLIFGCGLMIISAMLVDRTMQPYVMATIATLTYVVVIIPIALFHKESLLSVSFFILGSVMLAAATYQYIRKKGIRLTIMLTKTSTS